jgi:hypothetical protein
MQKEEANAEEVPEDDLDALYNTLVAEKVRLWRSCASPKPVSCFLQRTRRNTAVEDLDRLHSELQQKRVSVAA